MSNDIKIRKFMLRNFQNGIPAYQTAKNITDKFSDKGYGARTCQRWYRKFREGDFNLEIKPNHDRPKKNPPPPPPKVKNDPSPRIRNEPSPRIKNDPPPKLKNEPPSRIRNEPPQIPTKVKAKVMQKRPLTMESGRHREDSKTENSQLKSVVQNIIDKKREITVTKWEAKTVPLKELLAKANVITKRFSMPTVKPSLSVHGQKTANKRMSTSTLPTPKRHSSIRLPGKPRGQAADNLEADLKLTPSMAKRMRPSLTSTERYEGLKTPQKTGETAKKSITVQFQNVSPDLAKNTVRKPSESSVNGNKRLSTAQTNPLSSPKGVIYLNPQEIFRQRFGLQTKQPASKKPLPKLVIRPARDKDKALLPAAPLRTSQSPVVVTESDSEDDLVFPEDVVLPPPKVKAVVDTFTTYWDMETGTPILLNPTPDVIPNMPVIEID